MKKALIAMTLLLLFFMSSVFCDDPPAPQPEPEDSFQIGFKVHKTTEGQSSWQFRMFFVELGDYESIKTQKANLLIPGGDANNKNVAKTPSVATTIDFSSANLDKPQIALAVWTKNVYNFALRFKFTMMVNGARTAYGGYSVRIYKPKFFNTNSNKATYSDTLLGLVSACSDINVNSLSGVSGTVDFNNRSYPGKQESSFSGATFGSSDAQYDNGREGWLYPIAFRFNNYRYQEVGDYTATITVEVISNT